MRGRGGRGRVIECEPELSSDVSLIRTVKTYIPGKSVPIPSLVNSAGVVFYSCWRGGKNATEHGPLPKWESFAN